MFTYAKIEKNVQEESVIVELRVVIVNLLKEIVKL